MQKKKAFTLIELLVVIAIIAVLVAILMPSLRRSKILAVRVQCNANLHAIQAAAQIYSNDFNEWFPSRDECDAKGNLKEYWTLPHYIRGSSGSTVEPVLLDRIFFTPYLADKLRVMFCPGLLRTKNPDNYPNSGGAGSYSYFNYDIDNPQNKLIVPPQPDLRKAAAPANAPIWACLTVATSTAVTPYLYHGLDDGAPIEGMNTARVGGGSDWVPWPGSRLPETITSGNPLDSVEIFFLSGGTKPYFWPTYR